MLAVLLTLSLVCFPLTQGTSACVWNFQWSHNAPNTSVNITAPPLGCSLYFTDNIIFHNGDDTDHFIYQVTESEYDACDNSTVYVDQSGETQVPVLVPAGGLVTVGVSRGKLDLFALETPYLISEKFDGTCFRSFFDVLGNGARNCSATAECLANPPVTTTTPTTSPSAPSDTPSAPSDTPYSSPLNGAQMGLVAACCVLFCIDCVAIVVLIAVFVCVMCRKQN